MGNLFDDIGNAFSGFDWNSAVEVALLSLGVFWVLRLLQGTTAMTVVRGIGIVTAGVVLVGRVLDLDVINWLVNNALAFLVLFVLIVFQPEFRRALERVGRAEVFGRLLSTRSAPRGALTAVAEVAERLARRRVGALIVVERETGLQDWVETGVPVDAVVSAELLEGLFEPNAPLHDGAVILRWDRVVAASCILPLAEAIMAGGHHLGTRHRAGLGITAETDAVAIIVSEETGDVSVARDGQLQGGIDPRRLRLVLEDTLSHLERPPVRPRAVSEA